MAEFTISLKELEDLSKQLVRMGESGRDIAERMLYAGGSVVKEQLRENSRVHYDKGDMYRGIGYTEPMGKISERYVNVYPRGIVKRGKKTVSNALKGFVLNYGSPWIEGDEWFDKGVLASEKRAVDAMEKVFYENAEKIFKIKL